MVDVVIVGGGAAGLSAGVVLLRCRRTVVVVDSGKPRNARALHLHNFLTRDGVRPSVFLARAARELHHFGGRVVRDTVNAVAGDTCRGFSIRLKSGQVFTARKVIIATGVVDKLPPIAGFLECYGRTVHHCPYCDGYQYAGTSVAAFGRGRAALGLARILRGWCKQVTACTHGVRLSAFQMSEAARMGIAIRSERVMKLLERRGRLRTVQFSKGEPLPCRGLFFNTGQFQRSELPRMLGCKHDEDGGIHTTRAQRSSVPGVFVVGDAAKEVQFVVVAAAEGATAAVTLNGDLIREDCSRERHRATGPTSTQSK